MKNLARIATSALLLLSPLTAFAAFPIHSAQFTAASTMYLSHLDGAAFDITGNFTCGGWFKFTTLPASGTGYPLCSKWLRGTNQRSYQFLAFFTGATEELRGLLSANGSTNDDVNVSWSPSTGTWYHLAMVYTAATSKYQFFVGTETTPDAQQGTDQTGTRTSIFDGTAKFEIGSSDGDETTDNALNGKALLTQLWSAARTASQLQSDACKAVGVTSGLNGEWTLDNVLTDDSGNGNTLTNNNSVTFGTDVPNPTWCTAAAAPSILGLVRAFWF